MDGALHPWGFCQLNRGKAYDVKIAQNFLLLHSLSESLLRYKQSLFCCCGEGKDTNRHTDRQAHSGVSLFPCVEWSGSHPRFCRLPAAGGSQPPPPRPLSHRWQLSSSGATSGSLSFFLWQSVFRFPRVSYIWRAKIFPLETIFFLSENYCILCNA